MREIYADHAATTPVAHEVVEAMAPFLAARFGNASSVHGRGEAARHAIDEARARVADLIGATPEEIVFTASGSEANNLALKGLLAGSTAERRRCSRPRATSSRAAFRSRSCRWTGAGSSIPSGCARRWGRTWRWCR